jgi:hypothetical protein
MKEGNGYQNTLEGLANGFLPERGLAKVNVDSCNSAQVRDGEIS